MATRSAVAPPAPPPPPAPARATPAPARTALATGIAIVLASVVYLALYLRRDWIPFDDGVLAHTAERVLQGELPHRDFQDTYTGLLAMVHAAAFRVFGPSLLALRFVLLAAFAAWVPAVYWLALRFVRPAGAALATALCVAWSVPNYRASMPSWYNLFLATFAVAAVLRWVDTRRRRWLVLAGVCAGVSILVKIVGVYLLAGLLAYLVYDEQLDRAGDRTDEPRSDRAYAALLALGCVGCVVAVARLVGPVGGSGAYALFVAPIAAVCALLVLGERRGTTVPSLTRARDVLARMLPVLVGAAIPVALFVAVYALAGAVPALVDGVLHMPSIRLQAYAIPPLPAAPVLLLGLPLPLLYWQSRRKGYAATPRDVVFVLLVAGLVLLTAPLTQAAFRTGWQSLALMLPYLAVATVALLLGTATSDAPVAHRRAAALLLCAACFCTLTRFPFDAAIYFCYVAPLVLLAALAVTSGLLHVPARLQLGVAAFYLAFAALWLNPRILPLKENRVAELPPGIALPPPRGGIVLDSAHTVEYERAIATLLAHARGGYTYAGPDSPEVYFLSGLRNPTPTIFLAFDTRPDFSRRTLEALDRRGVTAVILNHHPGLKFPFPADLVTALEQRYPNAQRIGRFTVRWR